MRNPRKIIKEIKEKRVKQAGFVRWHKCRHYFKLQVRDALLFQVFVPIERQIREVLSHEKTD